MITASRELENHNQELTIEVPVEALDPYLDRAANRLASKHQIAGFRPGKAPLAIIRQQFGDAVVLEEAIQELIPRTFYDAVKEKGLLTVGQPAIHIEKLAPGNPVVYKATVAVLPVITFDAWKEIRVSKKITPVAEQDVDTMVDQLRELQATEVRVDRAAKKDDKVEVNFEVKREGAVIEGGRGAKFPLVLGKQRMIPGFEEQIEGLRAGEKKTFTLKFPDPYMQESLAGKEAEFSVELLGVFERTLPEANDEWASKTLGKPYADLRKTLHENLMQERESGDRQRLEHEMMEALIKRATFSHIPEILVDAEIKKMLAELEHDIADRGMDMAKYLSSIKKTREELEKGFQPQARERVKGALVLRALAAELSITVTKEELATEVTLYKEQHKGHAHAEEQLATPEFREYLERILVNRKTIEKLVSLLVRDA